MSDADTAGADRGAGRDYATVTLVAAAVTALVLAAALLPALTAGAAGTPAESLIPVPPGSEESGGDGAAGGSGGFGALNAGDSQSVGGTIRESNSYRSQDTETHFTVRSEEPAYWRTGAYDTYTGSGWTSSGPSDASAPAEGRSVRYRVELERPSSSPPTVWRPESVDGPASLGLTAGRVADVESTLPAGTQYTGVSRRPTVDESVLQASGTEYPAEIEERYTALPDRTQSKLGPFTSEVTANASNPYETAVLVEDWLESNKDYSLNVTSPQGDVATQFVFDMEAGYCEYFATSMVAMLRSQGVPARYVVGYSTGEQVDDNTYRVRALNAHAWVEVYFEGVGWVRFDPTPSDARVDRERQTLQEDGVTDDYAPPDEEDRTDRASDQQSTPTATPDSTTQTPADGTDESRTETSEIRTPSDDEDGYDVSLNRSAVPGAAVEVSVTSDGVPVAEAEVRFDGELVGRTGPSGTVVGTVPYTDSLTISVSNGRAVTNAAGGPVPSAVDASPNEPSAQENATRTVDVPTTATLSVSGDRQTGATVTVTATVAEVPVEEAAVYRDGELVGHTDDQGRATVALPSTPGNVTLRVERGEVAGERTLRLDPLTATVDPALGLPIAGAPVEVTAFVGGDPAPGATVTVGQERVGETGVNGSLSATLPVDSSVTVAVSSGGQTVRTTVSNPLANLVGVLALGVTLVGGCALVLSRRGIGVRDLPGALAATARFTYRALVRLLVGLAGVVETAILFSLERGHRLAASIETLLSGERSPMDVATTTGVRAASLARRALMALTGALAARTGAVGGALGPGTRSTRSDAEAARAAVRNAWGRFLDHVSVDRTDNRTPGQIATHAVAVDDLPPDAVATLRDEFRAVEYGPRSGEDAVAAVESAIETIEAAAAADADGENTSGLDADAPRTVPTAKDTSPRGGDD